MTDLLLKPEDTGEIPTGPAFDPANPGTHAWDCDCDCCDDAGEILAVGESTERLNDYLVPTGPFYPGETRRRPTVVEGLIESYGPHRKDLSDPDEFERVGPTQPAPKPMPAPGPPPTPSGEVLWEYVPAPYAGRHRRPSRWDWLTVPLAMAVQRIGRAL